MLCIAATASEHNAVSPAGVAQSKKHHPKIHSLFNEVIYHLAACVRGPKFYSLIIIHYITFSYKDVF